MLELKDIKKSYKFGGSSQEVLKGINIRFRKKEFVSILGSSGSGKTTLLNIIGGLDNYDAGDLIIDEISTKKYKDRDWDAYRNYRIGFIFQSYNLIMHQSVLQNVEIALTLSGISKKERIKRAKAVLKIVGLEEHINKKPNQLSGGQMQRVAIARALVNNPNIILADEPTGALDSVTSIQIMDLLKEISKDKLVIMVTHNPEIAQNYSTRIIELKDGLIINDSNPVRNNKEEYYGKRKDSRTSMPLLSSLSLSFNNLLTKKGRTFLISFAGSIGIIGIALIIALSSGVNAYVKKIEKESLSNYPLIIEKNSYDLIGTINTAFKGLDSEKCVDNKICLSKENINANGVFKTNNTKEFKRYLDSEKQLTDLIEKIDYSYDIIPRVYTEDYKIVNTSENNIFNEIDITNDKYELLSGYLPNNENEIAVVVNSNRTIKGSILYSLGIKDKNELSYNELLNKSYKVILNTDYYKKNKNIYIDYSNDKKYMKNKIDNGIKVTIVGIIREQDGVDSYIGYTPKLTKKIIELNGQTELYQVQINDKTTNALTGEKFDRFNTYDDIVTKLALYEIGDPTSISIYPKDYKSKGKIEELISKYNEDNPEFEISYSDLLESFVSGVTKVIDIASCVLIGFVAISLIVSSIMISIITYISVLERTKEIGILRAIGSSKKDIRRVFIAETIIEGSIAGILGIIVTIALSNLINVILVAGFKFESMARLPIISAIILIVLSIILNVIAGFEPANMAAKKDPVESLRTE